MRVSAIRPVHVKYLFKNLQFIRFQSVPSLAHFNPYYADSFSDESDSGTENNIICVEKSNSNNNVVELSSNGVIEILNNLKKEPIFALSFFYQLKERGFLHDVWTYMEIIKILCYWGMNRKLVCLLSEVIKLEKEHFSIQVMDLLEAMVKGIKSEDLSSLGRAIDALIEAYVSLGMFDEAIDILFKTKRRGVGPCLLSCNFLINRLVEHEKVDMSVEIYKLLKWLGQSPNVYTYGIVIKAYCRKGSFEEAVHVFREMEEAGVTPNVFTYTVYVQGLCEHGRSDLGYEVLRALKGENVPIDVYGYTVVIRGFVKEKKLKEAEIVLVDMENEGLV
ncbi:Pentatricopeptide repeat-containing protein [Forsythia ovata]|uniref:Pentatricopeptide repeat-containing protein n=1 Tax=Forsythia ovata TaxID=205694 RepID=A0ABD1X879_9LAMI